MGIATGPFVRIVVPHFILLLGAMVVDHASTRTSRCILLSVLAAEFALLGVWLGAGSGNLHKRLWTTGIGVFVLSLLAVSRPGFNTWELLLALARVPTLALAFTSIRRKRGLVLQASTASPANLVRVTTLHLLTLTLGVALLIALMQALERYSGPSHEMAILLLVVMAGVGGAIVPLVVAVATLGKHGVAASIHCTCAVVLLSGIMGAVGYVGTGSSSVALHWFMRSAVEAIVVCGSLIVVRYLGYRLARSLSLDLHLRRVGDVGCPRCRSIVKSSH